MNKIWNNFIGSPTILFSCNWKKTGISVFKEKIISFRWYVENVYDEQ